MYSSAQFGAAAFIEPEMVLIPAGEGLIGSSINERSLYTASIREPAQMRAAIQAFYIGKYEVANEEYAQFIDAGGYANPAYWSDEGWQASQEQGWKEPRRWRDKDYNGDKKTRYPVCAVSWFEAEAFCRWLSAATGKRYRLPSALEWEYAARGPNGSIFPWGNEWKPDACNWLADTDGDRLPNDNIDGYLRTAPAGEFETGKSPFGAYEMAGNVLEWCADYFDPAQKTHRMFRGGCFLSGYPRLLRCAWRGGAHPDIGHVYWGILGFRVARDVEGGE